MVTDFIPGQFFDNVHDALAPLSANTEYFMCIRDCSGNTQSINVPHATYTNAQGKAVVQMNTIVLGGQNGLNS